jgi:carboxymethylenebutenolidase
LDRRADMTIPYKKTGIPVYIACNNDRASKPAIILIHEVWGLNDHIKSIADRLCDEGFLVVAPDLLAHTDMEKAVNPSLQKVLFDEKEKLKHQTEIRAMWTPLGSPDFAKETITKLRACFDYLINQKDTGKIAAMGFCFGGTYTFNLAIVQPELSAAVVFYGHFDHSDEELDLIQAPIMAFYGEKDTSLTDSLPQLTARMKDAGKDFTHKVYPNCGHAFFNDTNELTYNKEAAEDSWDLALKFLNKKLK